MTPLGNVIATVVLIGVVIGLISDWLRRGALAFGLAKPDADGKTERLDWSLVGLSFLLGVGIALVAPLDLPSVLGVMPDAPAWFREIVSGAVVGLGGTATTLGLLKGGGAVVQYAQARAEKAEAQTALVKSQTFTVHGND